MKSTLFISALLVSGLALANSHEGHGKKADDAAHAAAGEMKDAAGKTVNDAHGKAVKAGHAAAGKAEGAAHDAAGKMNDMKKKK